MQTTPRPRVLLPRGEVPRPALRRRLLLRGSHHRHLLPAVVPGPDPGVPQRHVLSEPGLAQAAGFRACKRCLPDATPGSPDWDVAATAAGRAMRLIADGVVDREGVEGLAQRVGYTPRHLVPDPHRGARRRPAGPGPREARADRAGADRDHRPQLRRRRVRGRLLQRPAVQRHRARGLRRDAHRAARPARRPGRTRHGDRAAGRAHAVRGHGTARLPGDAGDPGRRGRRARLVRPHARAAARDGHRAARPTRCAGAGPDGVRHGDVALNDLRDTAAATERARRLLDADCDPVAVGDAFAGDPVLGPLVRRRPGLRVPGHVDGNEIAVRAVLGQQVCVAGARTAAARLTERYGRPIAQPAEGLTHLFPDVGDPGRARPRGAADAAVARPGADRARARRWPPATWLSTAAPTATTYAPAARHARHRTVDGRLHRDASARPPRRLPPDRPRHPPRAHGRSAATRRAPPSWPRAGAPGAPTPSCTYGRP